MSTSPKQQLLPPQMGGSEIQIRNLGKKLSKKPVAYRSAMDIKDEDKHDDVSNMELFCKLLARFRDKSYQNDDFSHSR